MKGNAKDYVSTAQQFFTAYDQSVRLYDQFASFSDSEIGGRVRGKRLADARTGDWHPAGSRSEGARAENRQLALADSGAGARERRLEDGPARLVIPVVWSGPAVEVKFGPPSE